jgi:Domain of unknown function (DUF1929)
MTNPSGTWTTEETALEIVGVHAVVLHTGMVLYWCFDKGAVGQLGKNNDNFQNIFNNPGLGSYQLWDPTGATHPASKPIGRNSFCAGQCSLADGTIFVAGGQDGAGAVEVTGEWDKWGAAVFGLTDEGAQKDVHTYDPVADSWSPWPPMADGRYYPTCQLLPDGTAFVAGGLSNLQVWVISGSNWCENDQFETILPGEFPAGPTAQQKFCSADQYPIIRLLPGSRKLFVHIETKTTIFDLDSASFLQGAEFMLPAQDAAGQPVGRTTYPMQTGHVLLPQKEGDAPRILLVGGSTFTDFDFNAGILGQLDFVQNAPAVLGAFIFEFNLTSPTSSKWRATKGAPTVARLLCDTVLLPNGTVFVVNGILKGAAAGHSQQTALQAEIFDPTTETFMAVGPNPDPNHPRGYHSTAVLLPDARVAIAGNTDAYNPGEPNRHDDVSIQIFSPPYLFNGPRPVVTGAPAETTYGSSLNLVTSGGPPVTKVMMMRPCAVTHSVDMDQRAIILETTSGAGMLGVKIPSDHSLAPPGFYMLFFLAADGTPSNATWILLKDGHPTFPPWDLGKYSGKCVIVEAFDGDLTLDSISDNCHVTLESRHGSITINGKIDSSSYANLKAAKGVTIGNTIDQHSIVEIVAGGDVSIGQTIDVYSQASITAGGKIDIGKKIDHNASVTLMAGTTVHIGQDVDQHSTFNITAQGDVTIDGNINEHANGFVTSVNGAIHIGQKFDQHSIVTVVARGDVNITEKIDASSSATITSANGSINIGQGLSDHSSATLKALNGSINIGDQVDGSSSVTWSAQAFHCPQQDGTITHV